MWSATVGGARLGRRPKHARGLRDRPEAPSEPELQARLFKIVALVTAELPQMGRKNKKRKIASEGIELSGMIDPLSFI